MRGGSRKIELTERILHLRGIPVGAFLPPPVLTIIATHLKEREFKKRSTLLRRGEPMEGLHLIVEGAVRLSANGREIAVMTPPQSLGFLGILAHADSIYDVDFAEDTVTLELDADTLFELLEDHVELLVASLNYIAERLLQELQELPVEELSIPFVEGDPVPDRELDLIDRIFFLRKMRLFSTANLNALTVVSSQLVEERIAAGTRLWKEGSAAEQVVMLVSGRVRCSTASGKVFFYGPNTVVGGMETLAGRPHWYSLHAETPIVIFKGFSEVFLDLMEENFSIAQDFLRLVTERLLMLLERRVDLGLSAANLPREMPKLGAVPLGT